MEHWGKSAYFSHASKKQFSGLSLTSGGSTCANAGQCTCTATLAESHHFLQNIWIAGPSLSLILPDLQHQASFSPSRAPWAEATEVYQTGTAHTQNLLDGKCHKGRNVIINSNKLLPPFIRHLSQPVVATCHVPSSPDHTVTTRRSASCQHAGGRCSPWTLRAVWTRLDDT